VPPIGGALDSGLRRRIVVVAEWIGDDVAEPLVVAEQVDERGAEARESQLLGFGHVGLWVGLGAPESRATTIVTSVGHALYDARRPKL
jgi:hypothetical protein